MAKVKRYDFEYITATTIVDAEATSATVCWPYSATVCDYGDCECKSYQVIGKHCENVEFTENTNCESVKTITGTIEWNNNDLQYEITQDKASCEENCGEITSFSSITNSWLDYPIIKSDETDLNRDLYYICTVTSKNDCDEILDISEFTGYKTLMLSNEKIGIITSGTSVEVGGQTYDIVYSYRSVPGDDCIPSESRIEILSVWQDKNILPTTGGDINYSINYNIISYDENCNKSSISKVYTDKLNVPPCACEQENCCIDTNYSAIITVHESDIPNKTVTISCVREGDKNGSICPSCAPTTCETYVSYCTSVSEYGQMGTTYYWLYDSGSNIWKWVKHTNISLRVAVPKEGGRIKVEYGYSAFTINYDCSTLVERGIGEKIIDIPPFIDKCGCSINYDESKAGRSGLVQFEVDCSEKIVQEYGHFDIEPRYQCDGCEECFTRVRYIYFQKYGG